MPLGIRRLWLWPRRTVQGLIGPPRALWDNRHLLWALARRDVAIRTSGTVFGGIWMFVQPALQILAFWFLLDFVLRVRFPGELPFLNYFLVGMVAWLMLADIMNRSLNVLAEFAPLYQRAVFPLVILPLLPALVSGVIYTLAYVAVVAMLEGPGAALLAPVAVLMLLLWLMPVCYLFALIGVFLRDLGQVFPFLITMIFFLTPILYMPQMMPQAMQPWMVLNPFADLMALVHAIVQGTEHSLGNVLRPLALWLFLLGPAWVLFHRAVPYVREAL